MTALEPARRETLYAALARKGGAFAMVALDQRVSLATMFDAAGRTSAEPDMDAFRSAAVRSVLPHASAILLETGFLGRGGSSLLNSAKLGLIVAVDRLIQPAGKPVEDSAIDAPAFDVARSLRAHAVKLLVVWTPERPNAERIELVRTFVGMAHDAGFLALVECIVQRNPDASLASPHEYLRAGRELHEGADIYKAQVPVHGGSDDAAMEQLSRRLSETIACPWVVLSTGIEPDEFPRAVAAACRGGASGFLAGRAVWGPAIPAANADAYLQHDAVAQLTALAAIVDESARPWSDALAAIAAR